MTRTASRLGNSETGPPRTRAATLHQVPRALALGAVLAASATVMAFSAPTVAAPMGNATKTLLSIVDASVSPAAVASLVTREGGTVLATYDVADTLLVTLPAGALAPVGTVVVSDVAMKVAAASMTAADVKGATQLTTIADPGTASGAGVTVAVVDTGVADVADLAGRVTHVNVSGDAAGDGLGHGTFMAGLVAGDGTASGGTYVGVAPQARILDVQVATHDGTTSLSRVLAGLQAVADRAASDSSLRVVSLALSTGSPLPPRSDPLARALDRLWGRGLTVVVAAGNDGPAAGTVSSPGNDPTLITVGSLDENGTSSRKDDTVSDFSSRGTAFGTQKPDLVAPGAHLVSTMAPGSSAAVQNPQSQVLADYMTGSGSSMAEAVTAGSAAVLLSTRTDLTPDAVKALMVKTAYNAKGLKKADGAGSGGLDLGAAVDRAATVNVRQSSRSISTYVDTEFGPASEDADTWAAFQQAWTNGDLQAVSAAWIALTPQTRKWAATAFAQALASQDPGTDAAEYAAVTTLARSWATQDWEARSWATDAFVARSWAARSWAARSWAIDDWAARSWADSSFTARSWAQSDWSARSWADAQFTARSWAARSWADSTWASDTWTARSWAQVDWLAFAWTARSWAARSWASDGWDARSWSARSWSARSWADFTWAARSWALDGWSARSWATDNWGDSA